MNDQGKDAIYAHVCPKVTEDLGVPISKATAMLAPEWNGKAGGPVQL